MKLIKPHILICLLLLFVGVIMAMRTYYRVPSGDEVLYQYVWEKGDETAMTDIDHRFLNKVSSIADIVQSQVIHYKLINGRSIVHGIEQAFTGHETWFMVINSIVFILFVLCIVQYSFGGLVRVNYGNWLLVVIALLVIFPAQSSLWISINFALNYLWPALGALLVLISLRNIDNGTFHKDWVITLPLLGFLFGWSHESFVVPIAGGTFLYYCFHVKRWNFKAKSLTIPMWMASILLVFAPGNFKRMHHGGSSGISFLNSISNAVDNMSTLYIFLMLLGVVLVFIVAGKSRTIRRILADNWILSMSFFLAIVFSLIANTGPHSFAGVELFSLLLLLTIYNTSKISRRRLKVVWSLATIIFVLWSVNLVRDTIENFRIQKELIANYQKTGCGIISYEEPEISSFSTPYIRVWKRNDRETSFFINVYNQVWYNGSNPLFLLSRTDYSSISNPDKIFIENNRVTPDVPVYQTPGGEKLWVDLQELEPGDKLEAELEPVNWRDKAPVLVKLKFYKDPENYPATAIVPIVKIPLPNSTDSIGFVGNVGLRNIKQLKRVIKDESK